VLLVVYLALCLLAASYNTKEIVYTMANEDKQNGIMSYSFGKPMAVEEEKAYSWYKDKFGMQQDTPPYRKNPQSLYKPTLDKTEPSKWESLPAIEDIINMFSSKLLDPLGAIPSGQDLLAKYAKPTFDINAGSNSIKILQRLAGLTGEEVDGGMGPNTLKAIEKAAITPDQYADARIKYYKEVVKKDPEKKEFLDGWITRANKYRE
jgi:hypothetical protein